jgi:hypothetical protein
MDMTIPFYRRTLKRYETAVPDALVENFVPACRRHANK